MLHALLTIPKCRLVYSRDRLEHKRAPQNEVLDVMAEPVRLRSLPTFSFGKQLRFPSIGPDAGETRNTNDTRGFIPKSMN
jgi:hypothetical protein